MSLLLLKFENIRQQKIKKWSKFTLYVRGCVSINSCKYPVLCVMKVRGWVSINSSKYPVLCVMKVRGWVGINSSKYPVLCVMKV